MNVRTTSALDELKTVTALMGWSNASSSIVGVTSVLAAETLIACEIIGVAMQERHAQLGGKENLNDRAG